MPTPSEVQQKLFHFISRTIHREQRPPSYEEMRRAVGLSSRSHVMYHLRALEELGYLEKRPGSARGIRLLVDAPGDPRLVSIPLRGAIVAGMPVFSDEIQEAIQLTRDIVPNIGPLYALRVSGDSMKDAQVHDGDIVVLHSLPSQQSARDGDMVAVRLTDRDEYTLKHFYHEHDRVRLRPANPHYPDILVHPAAVEIQGRVVTVIRQYH
ncbi:MAG: repressor LexA [Chloroflexi bacterium]|nr:repressor LexA [Chloroflexota bacterium]